MKKKLLATILAMSMVATAGVTATACFAVKDKQTDDSTEKENVLNNEGMEITDSENSPIRLMQTSLLPKDYASYGVSPQAEAAYTLEAEILPASMASFVDLEWTVEFQRKDATWADGKSASDYIKVTPIGELGHQAVVECLQGFNAVIVIKAAVRGNEDIFGSCQCNYICRYDTISAELEDGTSISFEKDKVSTFTLENAMTSGKLTFTGQGSWVGTTDTSEFGLSMKISDALAEQLYQVGFTVYDTTVVYGDTLYSPQLSLSMYGYETMLYLPGADATIVGEVHSELIKQGYLWATTGTNDDGVLSEEEWEAYHRYREAIICAWEESDDFLITLMLTQYNNEMDKKVLMEYQAQMDFDALELFPALSVASVSLNFGSLEF